MSDDFDIVELQTLPKPDNGEHPDQYEILTEGQTQDSLGTDSGQAQDSLGTDSGQTQDSLGTDSGTDLGTDSAGSKKPHKPAKPPQVIDSAEYEDVMALTDWGNGEYIILRKWDLGKRRYGDGYRLETPLSQSHFMQRMGPGKYHARVHQFGGAFKAGGSRTFTLGSMPYEDDMNNNNNGMTEILTRFMDHMEQRAARQDEKIDRLLNGSMQQQPAFNPSAMYDAQSAQMKINQQIFDMIQQQQDRNQAANQALIEALRDLKDNRQAPQSASGLEQVRDSVSLLKELKDVFAAETGYDIPADPALNPAAVDEFDGWINKIDGLVGIVQKTGLFDRMFSKQQNQQQQTSQPQAPAQAPAPQKPIDIDLNLKKAG